MLRTESDVRLAALFGSVARGDEGEVSDLDVLVELRDGSLDRLGRLRDAAQREVDDVAARASVRGAG